jgi:hypothetical protein
VNEQHVTFGRSLRLAIGLLAAVLMAAGMLAAYGSVRSTGELSAPVAEVYPGNAWVLTILMMLILLAFTWGWVELALLPDRVIPRLILIAIAVVTCLVAGAGNPDDLMYVAAFSVPVVFIGEMLRRDGREKLLRHVSGVYAGILMILTAAAWIVLARMVGGPALGLVGVGALLGGTLARYFVPGRWRELGVFIAAAVGSAVAVVALGDVSWWAVAVFSVLYVLVTWAMEKVARANRKVWQGSAAATFALVPFCVLGLGGYALGMLVL